jgi:uncharacterized protein (TIGR02118 family)
MYPQQEGKKFDFDYYLNKHLPMVQQRLEPAGLVRSEMDKATDSTSPFIAIGHLYFNSLDDFQKGFAAHSAEFGKDIPNYTDIAPQLQISEIVE